MNNFWNSKERSFMRIDGRRKTKRKSKIWGGALTGEIVQALADHSSGSKTHFGIVSLAASIPS